MSRSFFFFFFFSSRRRHTRWTGDWSSDVCSSDLRSPGLLAVLLLVAACNNSATPIVSTNVASGPRILVAPPEFGDQPSFADRTGRLPVLSLQSLFHPSYLVPND